MDPHHDPPPDGNSLSILNYDTISIWRATLAPEQVKRLTGNLGQNAWVVVIPAAARGTPAEEWFRFLWQMGQHPTSVIESEGCLLLANDFLDERSNGSH